MNNNYSVDELFRGKVVDTDVIKNLEYKPWIRKNEGSGKKKKQPKKRISSDGKVNLGLFLTELKYKPKGMLDPIIDEERLNGILEDIGIYDETFKKDSVKEKTFLENHLKNGPDYVHKEYVPIYLIAEQLFKKGKFLSDKKEVITEYYISNIPSWPQIELVWIRLPMFKQAHENLKYFATDNDYKNAVGRMRHLQNTLGLNIILKDKSGDNSFRRSLYVPMTHSDSKMNPDTINHRCHLFHMSHFKKPNKTEVRYYDICNDIKTLTNSIKEAIYEFAGGGPKDDILGPAR